jgi:DNA-binding LacI/PurR family transcriptional regulator
MTDDPRPDLQARLGIPFVICAPLPETPYTALWTDDAAAIVKAVAYLAALGHQRIARVAGVQHYLHTAARTTAMAEQMSALHLLDPLIYFTDFSVEEGAEATRALLSTVPRPTAIIFDNDVMAAAGLGVASEMGLRVPSDLSIVAWDNSMLSRLTYPGLTSIAVDFRAYGAAVTRSLLTLIDGGEVTSGTVGEPRLAVRGSTDQPDR